MLFCLQITPLVIDILFHLCDLEHRRGYVHPAVAIVTDCVGHLSYMMDNYYLVNQEPYNLENCESETGVLHQFHQLKHFVFFTNEGYLTNVASM